MQFAQPLNTVRENNRELNYQERTNSALVIESYPLVAKIEVTTRCNLRCTMCSVSYREKGDNGQHLDFDLFLKLKPMFPYLISTYLYGIGEPLLHPRIMDMFHLLSESGVNVGFITNGTLITEEKMRAWLRGRLYKISVSMDGATKEVYEKIRRWGDFDQLLDNLECVYRLKKEMNSRFPILTLNFVAMRDNLQDLLPLIELARRFDAEEVIVTELIPFVDEMKSQALSYEEPVLHKTYSRAEALAEELGICLVLPNSYLRWREKNSVYVINISEGAENQTEVKTRTIRTATDHVLETFERKIHEIPFASCTEPWSGFWLSQKGHIDPCCYWFKSMGDLNQHSFAEIWNGKHYQYLRKTVNHPVERNAQCRKCPVPS